MHHVLVPGWTGSGPDHWQSHLERTLPGAVRVEQVDWDRVDRDAWIAALDRTLAGLEGPTFLIGHSCGSVTIAQWLAERRPRTVVGALLVAPADVESAAAPEAIRGQAPLPLRALPVPTHVVVSDDDPFLARPRALLLARAWGSTIETVPRAGHIATADGYGVWPRAAALVRQMTRRQPTGRVPQAPGRSG
ncbi:RBBP9/YdeN family alpha/beta hydrolase [Cellulomonas oligotrophica]|uniref:Alpha/beta hydrolase n=1 Tax=Cellulomonas oligotrophica TaxID=931536 RepID=A0A7Y9K0K5_9CELL|nr:alpha/beta hydrolase [Cellulomonas oligotrophica]NYD87365.1 hypothetical protein [Cellulomonas oligotrophica]GIG34547.1 alpha/beta hydrolase [Cellulomonas oligotrophica]